MDNVPVSATQKYKDRLFRAVFSEKKELLELYNALRGTDYDNPDDLEINTLDNAVYMGMKNDLSFLIGDELNLYEHQSTFNPNMPLRGLLYIADLMRAYVDRSGKSMYSSVRLSVPSPHYIVFYNGTKEQPDRQIQKLSDSFVIREESGEPCLEMTAVMLNVNLGHNKELMERCKTLSGYAHFVALVRTYKGVGYDLTASVNLAVDECIRRDILAEFLRRNRAEVMNMMWYEYNEEEHIASEKEISFEEGKAEGKAEGKVEGKAEGIAEGKAEALAEAILDILNEYGQVPCGLREKVYGERDLSVLSNWLKYAVRATSIQEFENAVKESVTLHK